MSSSDDTFWQIRCSQHSTPDSDPWWVFPCARSKRHMIFLSPPEAVESVFSAAQDRVQAHFPSQRMPLPQQLFGVRRSPFRLPVHYIFEHTRRARLITLLSPSPLRAVLHARYAVYPDRTTRWSRTAYHIALSSRAPDPVQRFTFTVLR